jgi:hypothetical protein
MAEDAISVIVAVAKWLTETETAPLQQHYFRVKHAKEKNEMSEVLFTL